MNKICCFFGHSDTQATLEPLLSDSIEHLIESQGVVEFRAGNYGSFD